MYNLQLGQADHFRISSAPSFHSLVLCLRRRGAGFLPFVTCIYSSNNTMNIDNEKVTQRESWKQGCRAVFAGFVASAHPRGVRPA
jgi:hypothetical protein